MSAKALESYQILLFWLNGLSFSALLEERSPKEIEFILNQNHTYRVPPQLKSDMLVSGISATFWQKNSKDKSKTVDVAFVANPFTDEIDPMSTHRGKEEDFDPYLETLFIDLCIFPPLRLALEKKDPTEKLMASLSLARDQAQQDLVGQHALKIWKFPQRPTAPALEYEIKVIDLTGSSPRPSSIPFGRSLVEIRPRIPGRRAILSDDESKSFRFLSVDAQILRYCQPLARGRKGLETSGSNTTLVLHLLKDRITYVEKSTLSVTFAKDPVSLKVIQTELPADTIGKRRTNQAPSPSQSSTLVKALEARWYTQDGSVDVSSADSILIVGLYPVIWVEKTRTFYPINSQLDLESAWHLYLQPSVQITSGFAPVLYRSLRQTFQGSMIVLPPPTQMGVAPTEQPEFVVRLDGSPLDISLKLEAQYSFGSFSVFPGLQEGELAMTRDIDLEILALEHLIRLPLHPDPGSQSFISREEDAIDFWLKGLPMLQQAQNPNLTLMIPAKLKHTHVRGRLQGSLRVSIVDDWLESELQVKTEDLAVDMARLRLAVENKRRWIVLEDGSVTELTESLRDLLQDSWETGITDRDQAPTSKAKKKNKATSEPLSDTLRSRLSMHQLGRVSAWEENPDLILDEDPTISALRQRWQLLVTQRDVAVDPEIPANFEATLRPYQRQGLAWLQFLHALPAGGILADDMGLGKTLMTLAFLSWVKDRAQAQESSVTFLVVCPTSVMGNWIRECQRFTPQLRARLLNGKIRDQVQQDPEKIHDVDLWVTSYGLVRQDGSWLREITFEVMVLDEAQNIKNFETATAKIVRQFQAHYRLALSGTPVENRIAELYSLMEFCNPGMLGKQTTFYQRFEAPILANPRGTAAQRLRALIRPFVLRRTKKQVLLDLPPKEEIELRCLPGSQQRRLYDALAAMARADIGQSIAQEGLAKNQIKFLTALLRLRQMACDPQLVDPSVSPKSSTKRQEFLRLVQELIQEGRRALVFSQFVELLHLWRQDLEHLGIAYEYLDGSTSNRDSVVERFQNGDAPLFLISLKAGGTGLNLTAADTVIHCDPWWNPAVEDQATDRAHRIGQNRAVTVYRLITVGTVEEKILQLKAKKRELADSVITDDGAALQGISQEDVQMLLSDTFSDSFSDTLTDTFSEDTLLDEEDPSPKSNSEPDLNLMKDVFSSASVSQDKITEIRKLILYWKLVTGKKPKDMANQLGVTIELLTDFLDGKVQELNQETAEQLHNALLKITQLLQ